MLGVSSWMCKLGVFLLLVLSHLGHTVSIFSVHSLLGVSTWMCKLGVFLLVVLNHLGLNVSIFSLRALKRTCTQTIDFGLHSYPNFVAGSEVRCYTDFKGKSLQPNGSEKGGTHDAASRRIARPTHLYLSNSDPIQATQDRETRIEAACNTQETLPCQERN